MLLLFEKNITVSPINKILTYFETNLMLFNYIQKITAHNYQAVNQLLNLSIVKP